MLADFVTLGADLGGVQQSGFDSQAENVALARVRPGRVFLHEVEVDFLCVRQRVHGAYYTLTVPSVREVFHK